MAETPTKRFAVVTGASSGIGFELAKVLASEGFDLAIVAEDDGIYLRAEELRARDTDVTPYQYDLADRAQTEKLFAALSVSTRPIDALILNAGVGVNGKFVGEISLEDDLNLIALNISSIVHLSKLILPAMVARGEGRVLITSSIAALMPGPFYATYAASKAFLLSFSEALFNELRDSGVTVTALMPGPTDTNFFGRAGMQDTPAGQAKKDHPAEVARDGYEAMMRGDDHVIAGSTMNRLQGFMTHFMSERQKANVHRKQVEPEHDKQH
jgi:short-subunit dehydrogenase